jgi:hypothetical protein
MSLSSNSYYLPSNYFTKINEKEKEKNINADFSLLCRQIK